MNQVKRLIILLALASTLILVPIGMAQAKRSLECEVSITLIWTQDEFYWDGTITGDIEGDFIIAPDPSPSFPGSTEHFLETWGITTVDGNIGLYQEGVWNFKTGKWRSNGVITSASDSWLFLIGCNVHVRGITTLPIEHGMTGEGRLTVCGFR